MPARRLALALAVALLAASCAPTAHVGDAAPPNSDPCPVAPVHVVAVENFYGNLVDQIGGQCVTTVTLLADPDADPHAFQPTAPDVRAYQDAQLVVENGLGYDDFSDRILSTLGSPPRVINAGDVLGLDVGANPHVWYSARYVDQLRAAILGGLKQVSPAAAAYFDAHSAALEQSFAAYHSLTNQIATEFAGTSVGATESIFVDMADTTGLNLISPPTFMRAVAEGNEPSARDMAMFEDQIQNHQIKVLVYNTQTESSLTDQLQEIAEQNDVPMVGVSETMPEGASSFQDWQTSELRQLHAALQKASQSS